MASLTRYSTVRVVYCSGLIISMLVHMRTEGMPACGCLKLRGRRGRSLERSTIYGARSTVTYLWILDFPIETLARVFEVLVTVDNGGM